MVRKPERRRPLVGVFAAAGASAVLVVAAACSSSSTSSSTSPPSSSPPSSTAPANPAAAKQQIIQNWQKFFNPSTSLSQKADLLQNGSSMKPVLQGFASDPRVGQVNAKVSSVDFTGPTTAKVTYSLSLKGQTVLPNSTGQAVLQNGSWKVGDTTLCSLVQLSGKMSGVPGC